MRPRKLKIHYKFRESGLECGFNQFDADGNTTDVISKVTCFRCLACLGLRKVRKESRGHANGL